MQIYLHIFSLKTVNALKINENNFNIESAKCNRYHYTNATRLQITSHQAQQNKKVNLNFTLSQFLFYQSKKLH